MTLVLRYAARSDRGLVRSSNQDSVYAGPRLLALADGMGGHAAGEVASKVVIASLAPLDDDEPRDDLLAQLREAVANGNAAIAELVSQDPDLDGMGTTLTAVLFAGTRLGLGGRGPGVARCRPRRPRAGAGARRRLPRVPPARRSVRADHARRQLRQ